MAKLEFKFDSLPQDAREGLTLLADSLAELAGDELLSLSAFGGWLASDPFFEKTPARSVAVLRRVDLRMLDLLAESGAKFGKKNVFAPLIMTPDYIAASCDVFPLEFLEIKQQHALLGGEDHFAKLEFAKGDVRLQCERELKGELVQLRQGLLAAAGKHRVLPELCRACATRVIRMSRGVLLLHGVEPAPATAGEIVSQTGEKAESPLATLGRVVETREEVDFGVFERFYAEIAALAKHVDELPGNVA
jgi:hypothetical protein